MDNKNLTCPVCREASALLDVVDLNKSCEEASGKFLPLSGTPVYYAHCGNCGFCFAPEIMNWSLDEFAERIYNDQYVLIDPDYLEARPQANADNLVALFPALPPTVRHLDYGGGSGSLAEILRDYGWNSVSYDPFENRDVTLDQLGQFDLITAFEVFEHVPDVQQLMCDIWQLLSENGVLMFSTLLSDGNIRPNERLNWWYASPRNGHISLFSRQSLTLLAQDSGFNFGSFSDLFHVFYTDMPAWATHLTGSEKQD